MQEISSLNISSIGMFGGWWSACDASYFCTHGGNTVTLMFLTLPIWKQGNRKCNMHLQHSQLFQFRSVILYDFCSTILARRAEELLKKSVLNWGRVALVTSMNQTTNITWQWNALREHLWLITQMREIFLLEMLSTSWLKFQTLLIWVPYARDLRT